MLPSLNDRLPHAPSSTLRAALVQPADWLRPTSRPFISALAFWRRLVTLPNKPSPRGKWGTALGHWYQSGEGTNREFVPGYPLNHLAQRGHQIGGHDDASAVRTSVNLVFTGRASFCSGTPVMCQGE